MNARPKRHVTPLAELEKPCPNCPHQNAVHTGGADKSGKAEFNWPIYEPVWANATGWCNAKGCGCQSRTAQPRRAA